MKTWEMIKELTENPKKKFRYDTGHENGVVEMVGGAILLVEVNGVIERKALNLHSGFMEQNWEEVKEPVSFIEVLEVVRKNYITDISFENDECEVSFIGERLDYILSELAEGWSSIEIAEILLNSKFYIED